MRAAGANATREATRARRTPAADQLRDVPPAPETLEDAVRYFAWITHSVAAGTLDARTGHEAAYALNGFKAAVEKRDLQREVEELRRTVEELKKRPRLAAS